MGKKTLLLSSHHPHQYDKKFKSRWTDVWVSFWRGRRERINLAPCILSVPAIQADNKISLKLGKTEEVVVFPEGAWDFFVSWECDLPDIVANKDYVDKETAEKAIGWYIRNRYKLNVEFRYQWKKNKTGLTTIPF